MIASHIETFWRITFVSGKISRRWDQFAVHDIAKKGSYFSIRKYLQSSIVFQDPVDDDHKGELNRDGQCILTMILISSNRIPYFTPKLLVGCWHECASMFVGNSLFATTVLFARSSEPSASHKVWQHKATTSWINAFYNLWVDGHYANLLLSFWKYALLLKIIHR